MTSAKSVGAALLIWFCVPAIAQDTPRPAPDYFVDMVFATTTAQQLALSCSSLSFEIVSASRASGAVLSRLEGDGFDGARLDVQMIDPTPLFAERQAAFLERHGLKEGAPETAVCAAGQAEIAEDSAIAQFLMEVTP